MSESKNTGCFTKIVVILIVCYLFNEVPLGCNAKNISISDINGDWIANKEKYNPFNLLGTKGYYPVIYDLSIENGRYQLFYGSPGHLKLTSSGSLVAKNNKLVLTGFDVDNHSDYALSEFLESDGQINGYCADSFGNENPTCYLKFKRK